MAGALSRCRVLSCSPAPSRLARSAALRAVTNRRNSAKAAPGHHAFGQGAPPPQTRRLGVVPPARIAEESAPFVHDAALDERVGPGGEPGGLQLPVAIQHRQKPMAGSGPKPRACRRATSVRGTAAFSLAPGSKSKTTLRPSQASPSATTTTAWAASATPSSMRPKNSVARSSRSRSSAIFASVASIQ